MGRSLFVSLEGSPVLPRPSLDASRRSVPLRWRLGGLACAVSEALIPAVVTVVMCDVLYVYYVDRYCARVCASRVWALSSPGAAVVPVAGGAADDADAAPALRYGAVRCGAK